MARSAVTLAGPSARRSGRFAGQLHDDAALPALSRNAAALGETESSRHHQIGMAETDR